MKFKHLLLSAASCAAMLTGCLSEPDFEPVNEDAIEISLEGSINQTATKATAAGFETGDALGLYAVNYEDGCLISELKLNGSSTTKTILPTIDGNVTLTDKISDKGVHRLIIDITGSSYLLYLTVCHNDNGIGHRKSLLLIVSNEYKCNTR